MPDLHFAKPCTYTAADGSTRVFAAGRHKDVPDEVAGHWFVQAHLMKDGDEPAVPATAPLQHEERIKMKATLDAVEGRAKGAEAERDAAVSRADALQADLDAERASHEETRAKLEVALAAQDDDEDEDDEGGAADGAPAGPYAIARGHRGSYKITKGEEVIEEGLKKADAQAKVAHLNVPA